MRLLEDVLRRRHQRRVERTKLRLQRQVDSLSDARALRFLIERLRQEAERVVGDPSALDEAIATSSVLRPDLRIRSLCLKVADLACRPSAGTLMARLHPLPMDDWLWKPGPTAR